MATPKPSRPLYAEFLARVIEIEAMQCYRAAVTDDHTAQFFSEGRRPGLWGDFHWSLEAPEAFPGGLVATSEEPLVSLAMQHAWDAAVAAWKGFIAALAHGEMIASGVHPATGVRSEMHPAEWERTGLILDVRNGDLIEVRDGKRTVRWLTIVVQAATPEQKLGKIDWDDWWEHEVARRQQGLLPNNKDYLREAEARITDRYGVTTVPPTELRRTKAALYRGDSERPKRPKRKQSNLKG